MTRELLVGVRRSAGPGGPHGDSRTRPRRVQGPGGPVVDTDALTEALSARRIYAAALDVTDPEPLPRDHPLLRLDNVTITPHLGSATEQTRRRMAEVSVENLLAGLSGRPLPFTVAPPGSPGRV